MATSLQQQLAAIAANSTHQLDLKAQKARHGKSLLFEARDAASQSFDTIYQLCLEGFEELCHLDARFMPFSRNLFSEQSKSEDRTNMTAAENAELDKVIERFLGLLGGRLLLKPAMKAAEWLVRRFRVHEYNTEATLFTFLPYHSSHIFITLLSILPDQLPPNFRFLHPYIAQQVQNPPRHAIIVAASNVPAFFTAFSQYVLNVAKAKHHSALLLGFWASVTAQAVNGMIDATRSGRETVRRQREEDLLLKVLPILQSALGIQGVPELYLGSCMIMTILATKASLSEKVLNAMIEAVAGGWTEQTVDDGMLCLAVLAEEKQHFSLSKATFYTLLKQDELLATIEGVGVKCRVENLLTAIGVTAVEVMAKGGRLETSTILLELLISQKLPDPCKVLVLEAAVRSIAELSSTGDNDDARQLIVTAIAQGASQQEIGRLLSEASGKCGINLAQLDADLALQIQQGEVGSEEDSGPEPMLIEDNIAGAAPESRISLENLPTLPTIDTSFLDPENQALFDEYAETFQKASSSKQDLAALLEVPAFKQSAAVTQPGLLSFLSRFWTSETPVSARTKALQLTQGVLDQARKDDQMVDMQVLIPYLIAALADPAKTVRNAAAAACLVLEKLYQVAKKPETSGNVNIWGRTNIYGNQSSKVHWLSWADAHRVLSDVLLPILEDCVIDHNYVVQALAEAINGPSTTAKADRKELKQALRISLVSNLSSHVVLTCAIHLQISVLNILKKIGKTSGTARTQILLPFTKDYLAKDLQATGTSGADELSKALVANVTARSSDEIQFLKSLAAGNISAVPARCSLGFSRLHHVYSTMKDSAQKDLVDWLLELSLDADALEETQTNATETLRSLSLSTQLLAHLVETLPSVAELQDRPPSAKKRRTSEIAKSGSTDKKKIDAAISRITLVLELIESSKPEKHPQLLKGLFHVLGELHHYKSLLESELVYLQGLVINNLLSVVNGLKSVSTKDVDKSVIRPDLIVECVRTTSSTQVHQAALLLMSALASWAPDLVLHSVMPLFTFMSATILKQGDDYSAHVTDQTVSRIIPPLAASLKKKGRDLISGAAELLLSFTAAFEHIPLHRRAGLFQHLVETLGADESLFAIIAMLVERYPEDSSVLPFISTLMDHFPCSTQLVAVRKFMELTFDTLKTKRGLSNVILGYGEKSTEQATTSTAVLMEGLATAVASGPLRKKLAKELKRGTQEAQNLRTAYSIILEKAMQLELQLKANESLGESATNVLTSLLGLMPTGDFIEASGMLMQEGSDEIRRQVFWSLEQRVQAARRGDIALQNIFIELLPQCALFVAEAQPVTTRLAAIKCIDCIAERFGKTDRSAVFQAAKRISGADALGADDEADLKLTSVLCLASMVEVLGEEFIAILPKTLETIVRYMDQAYRSDDGKPDSAMLDAGFGFAMAVLDSIPWMLSGQYLNHLLSLSAACGSAQAMSFTGLAAKKISADVFLAGIKQTWEDVVQRPEEIDESVAKNHVQAIRQAVQHHTKATISKNSQLLFEVLLQAHDLRRILAEADDESDTSALAELVNATTMDAVLKLNDATFRPFFIRLGEWANSPKSQNGKALRQTSFFGFALELFSQLKSLVTSYASYLLEDAASLLQSLSAKSTVERELLITVLRALSSNFSNDQDGFWQSPAHFDSITQPLISRLQLAGTIDATQEIIPAIAELTAAVQSPDHHKTINGIIMAYMRHDEGSVRLAAVKCERALTDKLHIDWLDLLPEMLPFISELQEDDDGQVERETLRWIHQIEEVTGESLDSMLQ